MQDLRTHALKEYDEIHKIEIEILNKDPSVKQFLATHQVDNKVLSDAQADRELAAKTQ